MKINYYSNTKIIDLNLIEDIETGFSDVFVTCDDNRTYIAYQSFLKDEDDETIDFIAPKSPVIIVKQLTEETIEAAIRYYVTEDNGYWLKFYHLGTEIDDKTLNVLTDRWFAKQQWLREVDQHNPPGNPYEYSLIDWIVSLKTLVLEK